MTKETINIHGKQYETVASRVRRFRDDTSTDEERYWSIETDLLKVDHEEVIFKATISVSQIGETPLIIGTGYAYEKITITGINSTSAVEVCETSAIGRALASIGYAGSEYASADEMTHALRGQQTPQPARDDELLLTDDQAGELSRLRRKLKLTQEQYKEINGWLRSKGWTFGNWNETHFENSYIPVDAVEEITAHITAISTGAHDG